MRKFSESFKYAINGLFETFSSQRNFRIQIFLAFVALIASLVFRLDEIEILWVFFAISLVLILETLNTMIEKIMDFLHPDYNPIIGMIKDMSAAAVLIGAFFSIVVAFVIFGKRIFNISPHYGSILGIAFLIFIVLGSISKFKFIRREERYADKFNKKQKQPDKGTYS